MPKELDIKEFAERVERICDFFLDKASSEKSRDGSTDIAVLEKLKEDAADFQFVELTPIAKILDGLEDYMRGGKRSEDEARPRDNR